MSSSTSKTAPPVADSPISAAAAALMASAFVLAGLLVFLIGQRGISSRADAAVVIEKAGATFLTAETLDGEESLFVLDPVSQTLLVYELNLSTDSLELIGGQRLERLFARSAAEALELENAGAAAEEDSDG